MKIASFNAQRFGLKKALDPGVLSTLIKVKVKGVSWTAASCLDHQDNKYLTGIFVQLRRKELKLCLRYENNLLICSALCSFEDRVPIRYNSNFGGSGCERNIC